MDSWLERLNMPMFEVVDYQWPAFFQNPTPLLQKYLQHAPQPSRSPNSPNDVTKWACASIVLELRLLAISHVLSVLSSEADSKNFPPGWNTIPLTQLSWPACKTYHTKIQQRILINNINELKYIYKYMSILQLLPQCI